MTKIEQFEKQLDTAMASLGYKRLDEKGVFFYQKKEKEYESGVCVGFESVFAVRSNETASCREYWVRQFDGEYKQVIYPEGYGFGMEYESSAPVEEIVRVIEEFVRIIEQRAPISPTEKEDPVL